jgi:hypothetical protein
MLEDNVVPIFPLERSIPIKGYSVRRKQVPVCPAFCLTDYKVQGSTLSSAILDLKTRSNVRGQDHHKRFCSLYVQLSRLQSLDGLYLLQRIEMTDLRYAPDPQLLTEMSRLQSLQEETMHLWDRGSTN